MNLWRALKSSFDTEFKSSKKPLPRFLNLNLPRAGQLQRSCSTVCNSSSLQHTLQHPCIDPFQILVSDLISHCSVIKPITNLKLVLSKPSSQPVLELSTAGHRDLEKHNNPMCSPNAFALPS